jgi:succinate dehydrogenase / fumarate reductase, cytochrome b subunit
MSTASARSHFFTSVIGRKILVALTGLFLVTFLVEHAIGNLTLFNNDGGRAFEEYSYMMTHNPIIKAIEFLLFGSIIGHIVLALVINAKSRGSRKSRYAVNRPSNKVPIFSRYMVHTGIVVMIWLAIHLYSFFWQRVLDPSMVEVGSTNNIYGLVIHKFSNIWFVAFYVLSMLLMSFHLSHGLYSGFQTVGLVVNKKLEAGFRAFAWGFSIVISLLFASFPVYIYLTHAA